VKKRYHRSIQYRVSKPRNARPQKSKIKDERTDWPLDHILLRQFHLKICISFVNDDKRDLECIKRKCKIFGQIWMSKKNLLIGSKMGVQCDKTLKQSRDSNQQKNGGWRELAAGRVMHGHIASLEIICTSSTSNTCLESRPEKLRPNQTPESPRYQWVSLSVRLSRRRTTSFV